MIDLDSSLLSWDILLQASIAHTLNGDGLPSTLWMKDGVAETTVYFGDSPAWEAL